MKRILDLTADEARLYLLKQESYVNFDLPIYFSFQSLLSQLDKALKGKNLSDFRISSAREIDDVNYRLLTNKDGKYAWRPFQLIHPAIYVSLVHRITDAPNWKLIKERFQLFEKNKKIECHSLPVLSESEKRSDKDSQILTWWQMIEQKSISLALEYRFMLQTDISDCYGSIYTHSIPWALHTKLEAKKKASRSSNSLIGVNIDNHLQDMSYGQTNGIPQGSALMDFVAEMVLGYVDSLLTEKLEELNIVGYRILRFRDDYRIFSNNSFEVEQITKVLSEILSEMGLKLNAAKTEVSDDVIKSSIKSDKRYWIVNKRKTEDVQKWLIQLYLLSENFPNSGTLEKEMRRFLEFIQRGKRRDLNIEALISLVTEIAFRNPRVCPESAAILSIFLSQVENVSDKRLIIEKIRSKFLQIPNSSLLKIWLQRLYLKIDDSIEYDEPICQKVLLAKTQIWNSDWLNKPLKDIIEKTPIVDYKNVKALNKVVKKKEVEKIVEKRVYEYQD